MSQHESDRVELERRAVRIESDVHHLKKDVEDIREEIRRIYDARREDKGWLLRWGGGIIAALSGWLWHLLTKD